jgi:serine/threonine protein kinase
MEAEVRHHGRVTPRGRALKNILHKPGDLIGERYAIIEEIGQGGMQEVYRARDKLLARDVALKVPKSNSAEKRFKQSAVLSAKVNHANVAKTLDYVEDKKRFYLIEELVDGCDISELLGEYVPRLDPYAVARALHHLAKGIAASHRAGVVHRDLKPSNIMIAGGPRMIAFKITDFGIATMAKQELEEAVDGINKAGHTASQTALGALPYMAPEMIDDLKSASKPADIWALGAISYELLTGRRPFGQGYKAVPAIMEAKLPALPAQILMEKQYASLAISIYDIIKKCVTREPAERPTADAVVAECESLCYSLWEREFGTIYSVNYGKHGFIRSSDSAKSDVFYHVDSIYGGAKEATEGRRVWFSRFPGSPRERAFPVVPAVPDKDF